MLLADVVRASQKVAATRSRKEKVTALADLLAAASLDEVPIVASLLSGEPRQGRVGIGWATVAAAQVESATNPSLTPGDVDAFVGAIPTMSGEGSQQARRDSLTDLMKRATADEQSFLAALLTGELRQGALEGVLVDAIGRAAGVETALVRRALMLGGSLAGTASVALTHGGAALEDVRLEVLRPIRPMLAATSPDPAAAVTELGDVVVDWKLDGARIQVHRLGEVIRVYTRNLNDVTERVAEVVAVVSEMAVRSVVLDGESLSLDDDGNPRRFAETMSRFGAEQADTAVLLRPFFFDLLHLDGTDLVDRPLHERLEMLDRVVPRPNRIPGVRTNDPAEASRMLEAALAAGHEGVMVKAVGSLYEAGRRGSAWRKVKPVHTLDLMVLAAEWGHGRRTGWLSNLHLGCRDPETGEFVMLGKTFKGLTDAMLEWQTARLLVLEERRTTNTVWVRPELVAEIALDGLVSSPRYPAGMAMRFARVRAYRPDKRPEDVDTLETVRSLYERRT
ncbi:MAG: ATP-dependent DNA ligase [Acidimicrobiia bacterium]